MPGGHDGDGARSRGGGHRPPDQRAELPDRDGRRRATLAAGSSVAWSSPGGASRVRDLTHVFPVYTGNAPTRRTLVTIPENGFYRQELTSAGSPRPVFRRILEEGGAG